MSRTRALWGLPAAVAGVAIYDVMQKKHSVLRAFPVIGHGRYFAETIGPELRQYIVQGNDEERSFSRDQRTNIYSAAKGVNTYFGFGTDNDIEHLDGYPDIWDRTRTGEAPDTAAAHGSHDEAVLPRAKVLGGARAGCLHNTGEGSLSDHHRQGGDLVWQIGTGYFGCRDEHGQLSCERLVATARS